jgi:adenine deaminase
MEKVALSFGVIQEVAVKGRLLVEETKHAIRKIESANIELDEEDEVRARMVPVRTAITQTKFSTQLQEAENNRLIAAAKGELELQQMREEFERQNELAAARHQQNLAELRNGKQQKVQENYSRQEAENIVSEAIDGNVLTGPTTCYHAFAA